MGKRTLVKIAEQYGLDPFYKNLLHNVPTDKVDSEIYKDVEKAVNVRFKGATVLAVLEYPDNTGNFNYKMVRSVVVLLPSKPTENEPVYMYCGYQAIEKMIFDTMHRLPFKELTRILNIKFNGEKYAMIRQRRLNPQTRKKISLSRLFGR